MPARRAAYVRTARRLAASQRNILKAIAWRRSAKGNARARLNALKHGLFARRLEDSLGRLQEDRREYAEHLRLFDRAYLPQDETERQLVRRLAEAAWRRLRLFRAQARWEADRLKAVFANAPPASQLTPEETEGRAIALLYTLTSWEGFWRELRKLQSEIENHLRNLLRHRAPERAGFKSLAPKRDRLLTEINELTTSEIIDRLACLSPNRLAQVMSKFREKVTG